MGIPGLLGALRSVTYPVHLSDYRGLKAGVDAYCWLHRGTFSCGTELCTGVETKKYVAFCMKRVNLLLHHGIQPIMVFDGATLPMKRTRNLERRRQRETAMNKGEAALAAGEAGAAAQHFSKAVGVSHDMAFQFIKALRQTGVQLIVAPYEADAQLAFLSRTGAVDVVITEDSDCLPYGCKKVLFKMDNEGNGQEIQLRNLAANTPLSLRSWKNSMFLDLCLLAGCDYITTSVKGLGIATAHRLVDSHRSLDKIISAVNCKFVVPEGYWEQYRRARVTFRHHIIYNPETETTMHLMPLGDTAKRLGDLGFLGVHLQPPVAKGVGLGYLMPTSHKSYEAAASLDGCEVSPSFPAHEVKMPPRNATSVALPTLAVGKGVTGTFGDISRDQCVKFASQDEGRVQQDPLPSGEVKFSPTYIDNPFCGRNVLRELPFDAPDGAGWGEASIDAAAHWNTQDRHRVPASTGSWGSRFQLKGFVGGCASEGNAAARFGVEDTRRRIGRNLRESSPADPECPPLFRPRGDNSSRPPLDSGEGDRNDDIPGWRHEQTTTAGNSFAQQEEVERTAVWRESGSGEGGADERYPGRQFNKAYPTQEGLRQREFHGAEASTDDVDEINGRRGGGALALMGEPLDADQAKFVPASAYHFHSTKVNQGLETLQRRKRRLLSSSKLHRPELQRRQQQEIQFDDRQGDDMGGGRDGEGSAWMIQLPANAETADSSRGISSFSKGSSHYPMAPSSPHPPTSRAERVTENRVKENFDTRVLVASSRRWTMPSRIHGMPPANGAEQPLLRLLDGQGRLGGMRAPQPLPKRVRGTDFWDAHLLR